jgi:outer membrane lipoprotein-sorting protein
MKHAFGSAVLSAAILALAVLAAPLASAQGTSVHSKTPATTPPAAQQPAPPPAEAAPAPAPEAKPEVPPQAAAPQPQPEPAPQAAAPETNPLGVGGWDAQFGTTPPQTSQFTGAPEQVALVDKINGYFNTIKNLEGRFVQTDANDARKKGKFFIERPGKVRFDYGPPSRQKIISNGEYLAIEDHDLRTTDRYPLDSTPFRLLLKEKVDLANDARIIALDVGENLVVLTVEDKEARGGGQIRLFFDWPSVQLKEWIITDAQGLNTRIQLAELQTNKEADPKLFTFSKELGLPQFKGGSN